jgi:hypothetical protein
LAFNAAVAQNYYYNGSLQGVGGTSIVAPELAGFFAQENAYLLSLGNICWPNQNSPCAPMGNANYAIYFEGISVSSGSSYAAHYPFYDITSGCNSNDITAAFNLTYFCAGTGYDMATGWGSANWLQLAWSINMYHAADGGVPVVTFSGPPTSTWYNTDQLVTWSITDTSCCGYPPNGVAGFSQAWDTDPGDVYSHATPGCCDSFYDGPQFPNASSGGLNLTGAGSQGWHWVNVRAWDNTGVGSGDAQYGPLGYDTIAPHTAASVSGTVTPVQVTLSATDNASGVASTVYQLDGGAVQSYTGPFTVSSLGNHTLTFHSTDVAGNVEGTETSFFTVAANTTTYLAASPDPSTYGTSVTFMATVTSTSGTPTGAVTFQDGSSTLGTATLSGGRAYFSTSTLSVAAHSITATYGGGGGFNGSTSAVVTETVNRAGTSTSISSSVNPSTYGQSVIFTARVTSTTIGTPQGSVILRNGGATLGVAILNGSGVATFAISALNAGSYSITASYDGSANYNISRSPTLAQTVNKAGTTTTLAGSPNPSAFDQSVTFTATVKSVTSGIPGGTVTFTDRGVTLGSGTLNSSGVTTLVTSSLALGTHSIVAAYGGGNNFNTGASSTLTQTVNKANTTTTMVSSPNPSSLFQTITVTATVKCPTGGTPQGSVTFKDGTTVLGTITLNSSGVATLTISTLNVGSHSLTASYGGSTGFNTSASLALTQTVDKANTTTTLASSLNPSNHGQSVTFTATVHPAFGGSPTGTVTFKDGSVALGSVAVNISTHQAAFTTSTLASGTHSITASYGGDGNFNPSTSAVLIQTVH